MHLETCPSRNSPIDSADEALIDDPSVLGLTVGIQPDAAQFDYGRFAQGDWHRHSTRVTLPRPWPVTDLSRSRRRFSTRQREVFHYRGKPDTVDVACRVIDALGDRFDQFVFHSEFRVDSQESGTPVKPHFGNVRKGGTGVDWNFGVPCGDGRLKAVWDLPVWMRSDHVYSEGRHQGRTGYERGLLLFLHEFVHVWTAHATFARGGEREPLYGNYCRCHWREDLHLPAAFPGI